MKKVTPTNHPDYSPLCGALRKMEATAAYVNERNKIFEKMNEVYIIARHMKGLLINFFIFILSL